MIKIEFGCKNISKAKIDFKYDQAQNTKRLM